MGGWNTTGSTIDEHQKVRWEAWLSMSLEILVEPSVYYVCIGSLLADSLYNDHAVEHPQFTYVWEVALDRSRVASPWPGLWRVKFANRPTAWV